MKNIAIIPARSGSKGLKDKNIKMLGGKPLLAYSIEAALKSDRFDVVMVSTDSEEYSNIARQWGAQVPFLRSCENSGDKASSWDVVREVLDGYKKLGKEFDNVALLQPTSPLRTHEDIENAFLQMEKKNSGAVISVCEMDHSPIWSNVLPSDLSMKNFSRSSDVPRQQLDVFYRVNGALYLVKTENLYNGKSIYDCDCFAYIMPRERSIDIDCEFDFDMAEFLMGKTKII